MKYFATSRISDNIHKTPEGYLICIGVPVARTGEMVYGKGETPIEVGADGQVVITRDEDEVFNPKTLASFEGKPVTINHPDDHVTPETWKQLAKGTMQNVRRGKGEEKDDIIADLLITDAEAIKKVEAGLREVSCGYEAEYVQTGEGKGKQTNIVGNHLALVEKGRAGSSYAIKDHKTKEGEQTMKLGEKIKAIFAKAQDEALKVADEAGGPEITSKNKEAEAKDAKAYDELLQVVKDLGEKIEAMHKAKKEGDDAESPAAGAQGVVKKKAGEEKIGDEGEEAGLEARLAKLEAMVSKLMEHEAKEGEEHEEFMSGDEAEEGEESEDNDFEESSMVGDTASRAEILAPGIKLTKDVKSEALKKAYATKDGKKVIEQITGGKAPTFDSAEKVDTLFIAASELLKVQRSQDFAKSKKTNDYDSTIDNAGPMTAEKLNEINAKFYKQKQ